MEAKSKTCSRIAVKQNTVVKAPDTRISGMYVAAKQEISEWPKWKKDAYNANFAISAHAKKM